MDKIILVHYINIDGVPHQDLGQMMEMVRESLAKDADIISYIVPVKDEPTRIECVNPKLLKHNDDAWYNVKRILDRNQKAVDKFIKDDM
jgi:hypothetical protein